MLAEIHYKNCVCGMGGNYPANTLEVARKSNHLGEFIEIVYKLHAPGRSLTGDAEIHEVHLEFDREEAFRLAKFLLEQLSEDLDRPPTSVWTNESLHPKLKLAQWKRVTYSHSPLLSYIAVFNNSNFHLSQLELCLHYHDADADAVKSFRWPWNKLCRKSDSIIFQESDLENLGLPKAALRNTISIKIVSARGLRASY